MKWQAWYSPNMRCSELACMIRKMQSGFRPQNDNNNNDDISVMPVISKRIDHSLRFGTQRRGCNWGKCHAMDGELAIFLRRNIQRRFSRLAYNWDFLQISFLQHKLPCVFGRQHKTQVDKATGWKHLLQVLTVLTVQTVTVTGSLCSHGAGCAAALPCHNSKGARREGRGAQQSWNKKLKPSQTSSVCQSSGMIIGLIE